MCRGRYAIVAAATTQMIFAAVVAINRAGKKIGVLKNVGISCERYALSLKFKVITPPIMSATICVMSPTLLSTVVLVARHRISVCIFRSLSLP
jgi:hypothetical protein